MIVKDKLTGKPISEKEHEFVILNIGPGMVDEPESWGKDAIVVDPWSGIAEKACEGLISIMKVFNVDLKKEEVSFEEADLVDMDDETQVGF